MRDRWIIRPFLSVALIAGIALQAERCAEPSSLEGRRPLPVAATAYPKPVTAEVPVAKDAPEDIQPINVVIVNGRFDQDQYDAQARAARFFITTEGGPYVVEVNRLVQAQELPADTTVEVAALLSEPGQYQMVVRGEGVQDTAILNVRPPGSR